MDTSLPPLLDDPGAHLDDGDPAVRRLAVAGLPADHPMLGDLLAADPVPQVRAAAAEILGGIGAPALEALLAATADPHDDVAEAAVTALGAVGDPRAVDRLVELAVGDGDKLVREAAVAALGAVGDERARPVLLDLVASGPPQVRRRCVAALTVFDGADVEAALLAARADRNPMVREAAEMVVGRAGPSTGCC